MAHHRLSGGRLTSADYDVRSMRLEIVFSDRSVRIFKGVPEAVWRRLLSAPSAGTYFDDRIAEEYPSEPGTSGTQAAAKSRLDDLFGGPG